MKNRFPKDWDEKRIRAVISHYEEQTEEDAVEEDEAAFKKKENIRQWKSRYNWFQQYGSS